MRGADARDTNMTFIEAHCPACGRSFRERWGNVPEFQGYFWWEAWLDQNNRPPVSHDIIGQTPGGLRRREKDGA